jgi:hypothetical protein
VGGGREGLKNVLAADGGRHETRSNLVKHFDSPNPILDSLKGDENGNESFAVL